MMIRNIHTVTALLTFALASATTENLLRGNNNKNNKDIEQQQRQQRQLSGGEQERGLVQMDMNMGLGEMVCKERIPVDGSVVCTFRTLPPGDLVTKYVHHDCLNADGTNFCLGIEVSRMRYSNIPDTAFQPSGTGTTTGTTTTTTTTTPAVQLQQQQQQQQQQQEVAVGTVGRCPSVPQATGMGCAQYVPTGATDISCYFGRTKCDCELHNAVTEGWSCGMMPESPPSTGGGGGGGGAAAVTVTRPVTNPVTSTPPVQNIDANIQNVVVPSPTPPPVRVTTGQVLPNIVNPAGCPATQPEGGTDCTWGQRCYYYVEENGIKTDALSCDCDWSCQFVCRDAQDPIFQSF